MLRRLGARLLLVAAGVSFALLVCEIVLRVAGYSFPNFYIRDPVVGSALRPNAEGWWTREGRAYIRINSQGLRDREHAKAKPANTVRIALLGDSFAEALQVQVEQTFWAIAEARLQGCAGMRGQRVEVINFGVSGYGPAQELLTLRQRVWEYDPDIVLLAFTTRNDVADSSRLLKRSAGTPYFVFSDGRLVLDESFRESYQYRVRDSRLYQSLHWIRDHSRVVQAAYEFAYAVTVWSQRRSNRGDEDDGSRLDDFKPPQDQTWRDAWAVAEALVVQMQDDVRARHATFAVVTLTAGNQIHPDPAVRLAEIQKYGLEDFFYPDRRIKALCEREHIPVLVLAPAMHRFAEEHHVHLHGSNTALGRGHWNEAGHRVAGEMIAPWLCETQAKAHENRP